MTRSITACLLTLACSLSAADWPMWRHDAGRTAESSQSLPDTLDLLWKRQLPKPAPAFNDVRLQFDGGYEPVVAGGRLFMASGRENCVTAYDTDTGRELWRVFANGPVRLAPVVWKNRVLFGSDDGRFYCVDAANGRPVWKFKAVPSDRKLLGNKRLISVWPIRGGPVLQDGRVYFAAGVWPFEGVFIYCLDARTGAKIWLNDSSGHIYGQQPHNAVAIGGIAPQGYLLIDGDDLVVPSSNAYPGRFDLETGRLKEFNLPRAGRRPGGWYASLPGFAAQQKTGRKSLLADLGVNVIRHEDRLRSEGSPGIRTTIRAGEREFRFTNGYPQVQGRIHSMAAADEKLFVSTVAGRLYAFGRSTGGKPLVHSLKPAMRLGPTDLADRILKSTDARHGYAVFLGAPDAATLGHLTTVTKWHQIVVESDAGEADRLRRELRRNGIYADRVSVMHGKGEGELPPYFADLLFVRRSMAGHQRFFRSVRPYGGRMIVEQGWRVITREGALPGASNYDGDFTASPDELVKAPLGVLWFDDTLGHFKRAPQPRFIDGVMVSVDKDWLDASNRKGGRDYRLLPPTFTDVYTGRVLTDDETRFLKRQSFARVDTKTVQPSQYRPPHQSNFWKPEPPKAGFRTNPLTGEKEPRTFPKSYGCDGGFDYGHIYTMRSGTAAFYDKRIDSGTINISGPRSGCTSSIIPANGLLNLPYFYKGCTCSYPLPTGLALYSLPESHEQWTTWGAIPAGKLTGKIRRVGINFGAPADRMTESGTLWLDHPATGGPSPEVSIETVPAKPRSYYHHAVWMKGGDGWPWVAASGVEGVESVTIKGLKPGRYRVELTFANPTDAERRFNIRIQGELCAKAFSSGGRMVGVTRSLSDLKSSGSIVITLEPIVGRTQLSGIEIVPDR